MDFEPVWVKITAIFSGFDRTNWINVIASAITFFSILINNRLASARDLFKSRKEEFNKQIVAPFEKAIDEFQILSDDLYDLGLEDHPPTGSEIDALLDKGSTAQRKLSRAIKKAFNSRMCKETDWNTIGEKAYDDFVELVDSLKSSKGNEYQSMAPEAANAVDGIIEEAYEKIHNELRRYI